MTCNDGSPVRNAGARLRSLLIVATLVATAATTEAQTQANRFLDDSTVQVINLTMDPNDWTALQQNYQLNTYYHATFTWNGITENIGVRSHGGGSRSPVKPNLDLNFAKYDKTQTFLGLPFVLIKANNEDPSNLREWISMKLFRKMGLPAPREAPAQVYINGQLLGFYFIVEHEDETFLGRYFGESGGYLYEWKQDGSYEFNDLGTDPSVYASLLDLKTNQASPDLQNFVNLVQIINRAPSSTFTDDQFVAALSTYLNPGLFLTHIAIESALAESDGICGGMAGMNNFYIYQFQNQTLYQMIAWDKDFTFSDPNGDILYGITTGTNINLLAQRLAGIPQYRSLYFNALAKAESLLGGAGGWADQEIAREYAIIHDTAVNDPNKQCPNSTGLGPCGVQDFEGNVQWLHTFLSSRYSVVLTELAAAGYVGSSPDPQILEDGISAWGGSRGVSPGGLASIAGTKLGPTLQATAEPLPRILGDTFVSVEGVRAPLFAIAPGKIQFLVPSDIPVGSASIVVSNSGSMTNTIEVGVQAATPDILAVVHSNGSAVTQEAPVISGETLSLYATGLGAVDGNLPIGAVGPSGIPATTIDTPQVLLGNVPLTVTFSGLAPGFVGLYQVNVTVPSTYVSDGSEVSIQITGNGQTASWEAH